VGAWEAALHGGTLRANVPAESVGFRVSHPSVEVVDLGTEFTMSVDESGSAEVLVLKGDVEAHPRGGAHAAVLLLRERESRRFARAGVSEIPDHDRKIARWARRISLDRAPSAPDFVRWSFDSPAPSLRADATRLPALTLLMPAGAPLARSAAGRWAGALQLDGKSPMWADLRAFPTDGGTIAFWARIPADAPLTEAGPMVAFNHLTPKLPISLRWNRDPARGVLGALQTEMGPGYRTGATSLRDGQWHHLAVTFSAAPRGKPKFQVKQYVDARLDPISMRRNLRLRGQEQTARPPALFVGGAPNESAGFRGELDELVLTDRPLAPAEIRRLMKENRLE
jgi:hypothetical protein